MEEDFLFSIRQINCNHQKHELYTQRQFDILNGFEFNLTRCLKCHKIVDLQSKSFSKC
jgi:recombinational DNA repair protein (RecF pathway)